MWDESIGGWRLEPPGWTKQPHVPPFNQSHVFFFGATQASLVGITTAHGWTNASVPWAAHFRQNRAIMWESHSWSNDILGFFWFRSVTKSRWDWFLPDILTWGEDNLFFFNSFLGISLSSLGYIVLATMLASWRRFTRVLRHVPPCRFTTWTTHCSTWLRSQRALLVAVCLIWLSPAQCCEQHAMWIKKGAVRISLLFRKMLLGNACLSFQQSRRAHQKPLGKLILYLHC